MITSSGMLSNGSYRASASDRAVREYSWPAGQSCIGDLMPHGLMTGCSPIILWFWGAGEQSVIRSTHLVAWNTKLLCGQRRSTWNWSSLNAIDTGLSRRAAPGTYHELDILRLTPFQISIWVVFQYQRSTESA